MNAHPNVRLGSFILSGLGVAALLLAAAPARGDVGKMPETTTSAPSPAGAPAPPANAGAPDTATVLGKLHHSNQMEIEAGKLAEKNGASKDVRDFGKTLVKDHTAADKKVTALAKQEKIDLGGAMPPMKDDMMAKLRDQKGAEFDKSFAVDMLEDHKKDVAEATAARDATSDPKLKALLKETVPVLEAHERMAQKLVTTVNARASVP